MLVRMSHVAQVIALVVPIREVSILAVNPVALGHYKENEITGHLEFLVVENIHDIRAQTPEKDLSTSDIKMENAVSQGQPGSQRISELEQRYIKLLEKRIEDLEAKCAVHEKQDTKGTRTISESVRPGGLSKHGVKETEKEKDVEKATTSVEKSGSTGGRSKTPDGDEKKTLEVAEDRRYNILIRKWDNEKLTHYDVPVDAETNAADKPANSNRAFTFRKVQNSDNSQIASSEVTIESRDLQKLVGKLLCPISGVVTHTEMSSPFQTFIQAWSQAEVEANKDDDESMKQVREDLKELMKIISTSSGVQALDKYFKERTQLIQDKRITHDALCTLFPRGSLIVSKHFLNTEQVSFIESCSSSFERTNEDAFVVTCYILDWNGSRFARVPFELSIPYFTEKKDISELPFFPMDYYTKQGKSHEDALKSLRESLVKRGKYYTELCTAARGKQMFLYEGSAYHQKTSGILRRSSNMSLTGWDDGERSQISSTGDMSHAGSFANDALSEVKGTVIVDFKSYLAYQTDKAPLLGNLRRYRGVTECDCPDCRQNKSLMAIYRWDWDNLKDQSQLTEDHYLCLPPRVLGYSMEKKRWMQLHVSKVHKWEQTDEQVQVFTKKLQLKKEYKELIQKSVRAHETGSNESDRGIRDFAEGKGKGLVILLYGVPGVGKTLTAESVARFARKPLFAVGVSDIGIEGQAVEVNLQKIFDLAGLWEAVLLFDEADVFLESRGRSGDADLKRNTMVSVLLRVLEYYEGILILTTNRMRTFDIAVQSRIHLAIKYVDLTEQQRSSIFMSFFEQLESKDRVESMREIKQWVEEDGSQFNFNGRQIRNVVSTAMGLARAERPNDPKLTRAHLALMARQTSGFQRELEAQETIYRAHQIERRH